MMFIFYLPYVFRLDPLDALAPKKKASAVARFPEGYIATRARRPIKTIHAPRESLSHQSLWLPGMKLCTCSVGPTK